MTLPTAEYLDPAIGATWPAGKLWQVGGITMRAQGGGQRATAATCDALPSDADLQTAEREMFAERRESLFRVRPGQEDLAAYLDERGYGRRDETNYLVMDAQSLAQRDLRAVSSFSIWPPLAIMEDLWAASGTGSDRLENMHRVKGAKTGILGRAQDKPGGVGFVGVHNDVAMIHAVAVSSHLRRQKIAHYMMIGAARFAVENGARWICALCTVENEEANLFYETLGMSKVGSYHYRAKKPQG